MNLLAYAKSILENNIGILTQYDSLRLQSLCERLQYDSVELQSLCERLQYDSVELQCLCVRLQYDSVELQSLCVRLQYDSVTYPLHRKLQCSFSFRSTECQINQLVHQLCLRDTRICPQLRIHTNICKTRNSVDFI